VGFAAGAIAFAVIYQMQRRNREAFLRSQATQPAG